MIIKGQVRGAIGWLADHLTSTTNNEKVTLITSNVGTDIKQTLYDMRTMHGSDKRNVIHFKLAVEHSKSNSLSIKDWKDIAKELVRFYGLKNHAHTLLLHEKDNVRHAHLVVSMKDFDGKRFNDHKIFQRNMACQKLICERLPHLGLTPARRGFDENGNRISKSRKSDADFSRESVRGHVDGLSALEVANLATKLWQEVQAIKDGQDRATAFQRRMQANGFALFEGNRGPGFVHNNDPTNFHPLARRLGIKVKEARELMRGLELPPYVPATKGKPHPPEIIPAVLAAQSRRTKRNDEHAQDRAFRRQKGEELSRQRHADDRRQERLERLRMMQGRLGSATGMARKGHPKETAWVSLDADKIALHRHLKAQGLETSGVWKSNVDDSWRFSVRGTRETIAIYNDRITVHTRPAPSPSSDRAIQALIETAKSKGWKEMTFFGPEDFRKRAALEAVRHGIKLADPDLKNYVEKIKARPAHADAMSKFRQAGELFRSQAAIEARP